MGKFVEVKTDLGIVSIRIDAITTFKPSVLRNETLLYILHQDQEPCFIKVPYEEFKRLVELEG
jgi:hypothetical protein